MLWIIMGRILIWLIIVIVLGTSWNLVSTCDLHLQSGAPFLGSPSLNLATQCWGRYPLCYLCSFWSWFGRSQSSAGWGDCKLSDNASRQDGRLLFVRYNNVFNQVCYLLFWLRNYLIAIIIHQIFLWMDL